jgi:hypothetical protein
MNVKELLIKLLNIGVRRDAFSLDGGLPSEAYCLNNQVGRWEVYYSEKGQKSGLQFFDNEDDACRAFLNLIMADESVLHSADKK